MPAATAGLARASLCSLLACLDFFAWAHRHTPVCLKSRPKLTPVSSNLVGCKPLKNPPQGRYLLKLPAATAGLARASLCSLLACLDFFAWAHRHTPVCLKSRPKLTPVSSNLVGCKPLKNPPQGRYLLKLPVATAGLARVSLCSPLACLDFFA